MSNASNSVSMEACDPMDIYESFGGDSAGASVDQCPSLLDDASTTVIIPGNILDDDNDDWFVISAQDDINQDLNAGIDYFRFQVELTEGAGDYAFTIFRGSQAIGDLECSNNGYTHARITRMASSYRPCYLSSFTSLIGGLYVNSRN